jgi:GntR family transcriptional regulator / MocR family aminotransferase
MTVLKSVRIDLASPHSITQQIYLQLKQAILEQSHELGEKLPSIRGVSLKLHVNKSCVVHAYEKLSAEGLLISKPHKGFYICPAKMMKTE